MRKFTRFLGIALIIVGLVMLAYNLIPSFVINQQADDSEVILQDATADQLQENKSESGEIDFSAIEDISADAALNADDIDPNLLVGQLVIPSIDLNLPIFKSMTNSTLLAGAAIMEHDQVMGEGNYAIAGHYTHTSDNLFGPLRDLEEGATIRLTDKNKIYEYELVNYEVVPATAVEMIEDGQADQYAAPIISLMRCYYVDFQKTPDREFYIGQLVDTYEYSPDQLFAE